MPDDSIFSPEIPSFRPRTREEILARRDALYEEKDANNQKMAECKAQIDQAKADFKVTGEHADPDWYASVKAAARFAGKRDQEIARELSSLAAELRVLNAASEENNPRNKATLRDHMAMAAINGILASEIKRSWTKDKTLSIIAQAAYELADAMLEVRNAKA